jgi:ABC-type transport system involved in multi-copper enzyme maturation permease subunit
MSLKVLTWQEAFAAALWLVAVAGLFGLDLQLPDPVRAALWVVLAVGLLIVLRRFWSWLLGPLFVYDLVRTARRNRLIPVRLLYALLMLLIISVTYSRWFGFHWSDGGRLFEPPVLRPDLLPSFANSFFTSFVMLLISAVFLLTPIYLATAIVEERERGNLDLLLITPLTNREIVLGIMMSRLATLSLILATGLPILSLLPFFGGVDPTWVLGAFAMAGWLMLLQGSLSIYVSVGAPNSLRAIVNAYLQSLALGGFCCLCQVGVLYSPPSPFAYFWDPTYLLAIFPGGLVSFFFVGFAIARLRRPVKEFEPRPVPPRGWDSIPDRPPSKELLRLQWLAHDLFRLPITDPPMLWKDFHRRRRDNLPRLIAALSVCFYLYFCLVILATESGRALRALGPWATCIMLIPVAITSARMVSQEKEKRTLDSLLVTDLDPREVLFGKWWATMLPMRWILAIQAAVLFMAGLGGLLHPLAAVYLLGATVVYTCFVACLGLFVSTLCETVLKSTMISVAALIVFVFAGPLGLVSPSTNPRNGSQWWFGDVLSYALSPIDALRCLAFKSVDWGNDSLQAWQIVASLSAIGLVALATWGLWKLTLLSFERAVKGPAPRAHS